MRPMVYKNEVILSYFNIKKKLSEKDKKNHVKKNSDTEFFKKL